MRVKRESGASLEHGFERLTRYCPRNGNSRARFADATEFTTNLGRRKSQAKSPETGHKYAVAPSANALMTFRVRGSTMLSNAICTRVLRARRAYACGHIPRIRDAGFLLAIVDVFAERRVRFAGVFCEIFLLPFRARPFYFCVFCSGVVGAKSG